MKPLNILSRKRINTLLSAVFDYPLTILEAPMGFGKTTAVKNFIESENRKPLWITFKNYSDSASTFWGKFIDEISNMNCLTGEAMQSLGFPTTASQLTNFFLYINEVKFDKNTLLILDDYQLIHDEQLNRLILLLAEEEISGFHILIITRDTSDINFVELYSKDLCHLITKQQLKFNDDEIRAYCQLMVSNISEHDLIKLSEYTEGWISFMYIVLRGLENEIPIGMNITIEELIEKALFDCYVLEIQDFLLKLSIMEDFTAAQAEYVTQNKFTFAMLKKLNRENAFVYYDDKNSKYKIHNVLVDFLRQKQNFPKDIMNQLFYRLGEWYYKNNELLDAYRYLYKAGENDQLLVYLNNPLNIRDHLTNFEGSVELFQNTPKEVLYCYPFAYLQHIFLSIMTCDINDVSIWEEKLDEFAQYYDSNLELEESIRNRVLSELLIIRKFTLFNHIEEMKKSNEDILRLIDGQHSYIALQENAFTFGSPHYLYLYFRDVGSFQKIATILSEEVGYAKFSNGCGSGGDSLALAEYALETGDFEHIELHCEQARIKAEKYSQTSVIICSRFSLMRYRLYEGRITEAMELMKVIEMDAAILNDSLINTSVELCKGYIFACLGQLEKIPLWLQTGDMSIANLVYEGVAFNYLVYGKAVMLAKQYAKLEVLTEQFDDYFSQYSNHLGFIHNGIFKAVAKFNLYGSTVGSAALEVVLIEAAQDQIVMPFIESAPYITQMLHVLSSKNPDNEFISRIIINSRFSSSSTNKVTYPSVALSPREIEIITLIDQGFSRKQIAERLCISQETAKSHLKNLYQKLGVGEKVSAVKAAKSLGILPM